MPRWANSTIETYYGNERVSVVEPCEVVIEQGRIAFTLTYAGLGPVTFAGPELEPGHFHLKADKVSASGSLHKFSSSRRLEGYWIEDQEQGMWCIELSNEGE